MILFCVLRIIKMIEKAIYILKTHPEVFSDEMMGCLRFTPNNSKSRRGKSKICGPKEPNRLQVKRLCYDHLYFLYV